MAHFHQYLKDGDYFVVEDINPHIPQNVGTSVTAHEPCELFGTTKLDDFKAFFRNHDDYYAIDSFFANFYGYKCSWMWHRYVWRMKSQKKSKNKCDARVETGFNYYSIS